MKKFVQGLIILIAFIAIAVVLKFVFFNETSQTQNITGAVGGGKENLLSDKEFNDILAKKYYLVSRNDPWSNGKLVKDPVVDEKGKGYDFIFFSDQRFYDQYKLAADTGKGEAPREKVLSGLIALNTPIVIYSWDKITDVLIEKGYVEVIDGVYYLTKMEEFLKLIIEGKQWKDIGINDLYGKINISCTDPVTSSPGATWYALIASVLSGDLLSDEGFAKVLPSLKNYYDISGFMNNTPADLFEAYMKQGMGSKPMIVDYEKSIIEFAVKNPENWGALKDKIRILYPVPTVWNSHCIAALTEQGQKYTDAFNDLDIRKLAWEKYGFRTGISLVDITVKDSMIPGLPQEINQIVPPLKISTYEMMIGYLNNK